MTSSSLNKSQLERLLNVSDPTAESMYGVIGRMKILLDYFQSEPIYHNFVPFLKTYYYVTKASAEKYISSKHYFWSLKDYETLDVYFASLYFKPLLAFLTHTEFHSPWRHYFHYCNAPNNRAFLKIVLGINAHINTDLYAALVHIKYKHENDFLLVNKILREVTPDVTRFLVFSEHDILGMTGMLFKHFFADDFNLVLDRWRKDAWDNAAATTPKNEKEYFQLICKKTEDNAKIFIYHMEEAYHLHHPTQILSDLHTLSTRIV
jgi:hypothetical protein